MRGINITQTITDRQDASLGLYFKDVSKQSLINANEEIELAERIKNGDKQAEEKLILANLRFVISVAKQYQNKGLSLVDLIQEGNLGMLEAVKHYNPDKGVKFISYAVWWIKQAITQAISDQSRTIRAPMNQIVSMNKISKAAEKLEQELGRTPSSEEIALRISTTPEKVNITLNSINKSLSLNNPFTDEEAGCLLDIIPDENSIKADNNLLKESVLDRIESVLCKLSDREGDIIRMSFGLGMLPMTYEEISNRFGICSERVRQLQHTTLEKLKKNYSNILRELL